MRRDVRKRTNQDDDMNMKIIKYTGVAIAILTVIVLGLFIYSKSLNNKVKEGTLSSEQISSILNSSTSNEQSESASTEIGKSVNEANNEINKKTVNSVTNNTANTTNRTDTLSSNTLNINNTKTTDAITKNETANKEKKSSNITESPEASVELDFQKPVEGDVVRDFSMDSLIFSETLQEWTTHSGIDLKADKTTVVKAAEKGTVKTIKNDPRYGLTVTIEHSNGFKTVYSNLLTSEFIVEGEKVEKGQSIGTVGNTAAFEIADEPHLHFEIWKDSVVVDPNIYLK